MRVIRTFVAVLIAENLKKKIGEVQEQVKTLAPEVKWVAPDNFHVTLKFLGSIREDEVSPVSAAIEEVAHSTSPFDLSFAGLGAFPSPARARVVWVGIQQGREALIDLAAAVETKLSELGYEKEDRPFKAHITIGRAKEGRPPGGLAAGVEEIDASDLGTQRVEGIALMQSDLQRSGPIYMPLSESRLGG